jgi:hypothetical protein
LTYLTLGRLIGRWVLHWRNALEDGLEREEEFLEDGLPHLEVGIFVGGIGHSSGIGRHSSGKFGEFWCFSDKSSELWRIFGRTLGERRPIFQ